jgi:hypothetical protein
MKSRLKLKHHLYPKRLASARQPALDVQSVADILSLIGVREVDV